MTTESAREGDTGRQQRTSWREPSAVAVVLGLSLASIDILMTLPDSPESWRTFGELLPPFAVTATLTAAVFLLAWYLIVLPCQRKHELPAGPLLAATAAFLGASLLLASDQKLFDAELIVPDYPLRLGILAVITAAIAHSVYWLLVRFAPGRSPARLGLKLCLAVPVVLVVTLVHRWVGFRAYDPSDPGIQGYMALIYIAAVFVAVLFVLVPPVRIGAWLLATLFVASVAAGGVSLLLHDDIALEGESVPAGSSHAIPRVILISVDTLRADALSCYNPETPSTPHFDRLAADSVVFRHAYCSGAWTIPSIISLLTALPTAAHRMNADPRTLRLPDEFPTLAEHMRDAGYATAAIVENLILDPRLNI